MQYTINKKGACFFPAAMMILISSLFSCGNGEKPEVVKEEEGRTETDAMEVTISREQYETINIQLADIEKRNLTSVLKATGFLKVPPQNKASITSAIGGVVQNILIQEGDYVTKGQTLLVLVNPDFVKLQEEFLEAQSQIILAEAEFNRQKTLSENSVSSQKTFQQSQADFNTTKTRLSSLKQQLSLLGVNTETLTQDNVTSAVNIKSPISGSVSDIDINIGSNIEHSESMMNVVDNSQLHLDLFIYEQDLMKVKVGQNIDFTLTNLPGKSFTAKIFAIGNAFESETRTIGVHASIPGDKTGLIEGMNVTGMIDVGNNYVAAVPSSAITSAGSNDYIFIHEEQKTGANGEEQNFTFKRIQIKKGVTEGAYSEITPLEEIPQNVKVVTNGSFYLMAVLTNEGEEE
jgi:cobalt-zinc-cadmium efflux system membrane fusion protein